MNGWKTRVGRRGAILLCAAVIHAAQGWALLVGLREVPDLGLRVMPVDAWGVVWLAVALTCAFTAALRHDEWGYALGAFLAHSWSALAALSWLQSWLQSSSHAPELVFTFWAWLGVGGMLWLGSHIGEVRRPPA